MKMRKLDNRAVAIADRLNAVQFWLQRLQAFLIYTILVHACLIKIADLLMDGIAFGVVHRSFLQNVLGDKTIAFGEFTEAAPPSLIGRNGIVFDPGAADKLVKVITRIG